MIEISSDFNFTLASWFLGNVHVKPISTHSAPPPLCILNWPKSPHQLGLKLWVENSCNHFNLKIKMTTIKDGQNWWLQKSILPKLMLCQFLQVQMIFRILSFIEKIITIYQAKKSYRIRGFIRGFSSRTELKLSVRPFFEWNFWLTYEFNCSYSWHQKNETTNSPIHGFKCCKMSLKGYLMFFSK